MKSLRQFTNIFIVLSLFLGASASAMVEQVALTEVAQSGKLSVDCTIDTLTGACVLGSGRSSSWILNIPPFAGLTDTVGAFRVGQTEVVLESLKVGHSDEFAELYYVVGGVGADLLRGRDLTFDFANMFAAQPKLYFSKMIPNRKSLVRGRLVSEVPMIVELQIEGTKILALWDTEAKSSLNATFARNHPEVLNNNAQLAGEALSRLTISTDQRPYEMVLGIDMIRRFTWIFDKAGSKYEIVARASAGQ